MCCVLIAVPWPGLAWYVGGSRNICQQARLERSEDDFFFTHYLLFSSLDPA